MRTRLVLTTVAAVLCLAATSDADAAVHVRHTVDRQAPAGVLPHQTFTATGLVNGADYRIGYRIHGRRGSHCTSLGSSIGVRAHRGQAVFAELPSGSYTGGHYSGFCAGRRYDARVILIRGFHSRTVKRFVITGAPRSSGPSSGGGTTPGTGGSGGGTPRMTFTDDPSAPAGAVPAKIAHLSGLVPGASYRVHVVDRTPGTNCLTEGDGAQLIVGSSGAYDAPVPYPFYGQGQDLCAGATYDATLYRDLTDTSSQAVLTGVFTASAPRR